MKKTIITVITMVMLLNVFQTFSYAAVKDPEYLPDANPYTSYSYNASRAVKYANAFYKNRNVFFYEIPDENGGDCTNFVSQCIAYGFGSGDSYTSSSSYRMYNNNNASTGWFGGAGGGSSAWENVNSFWTYMRSSKTNLSGPRTSEISQSLVGLGDIMQVDFNYDGVYDHSVICVDTSPLTFAQHTNNTKNQITAYTGNKRFLRPTSFREY